MRLLSKIVQIFFLLIIGAVGIMLIYFASVHSHQITEKVETNAIRVEMVIENQRKIIKNQDEIIKTMTAITSYLNKPQLKYKKLK